MSASDRSSPATQPALWHLPWILVYLLARQLIALRLTPETRRELERLAELRRTLIRAGWFN